MLPRITGRNIPLFSRSAAVAATAVAASSCISFFILTTTLTAPTTTVLAFLVPPSSRWAGSCNNACSASRRQQHQQQHASLQAIAPVRIGRRVGAIVGMNADTEMAPPVEIPGVANEDRSSELSSEPCLEFSPDISANEAEGMLKSEDNGRCSSSSGSGRRPSRVPGGRKVGDVVGEGFSGTRRGFQVQKTYTVPEEAPTNLPDGEESGYPMLIYQFMHAQYPEEFSTLSSARKAVRRKELLLNGREVKNDSKVSPGDEIVSQKRTQPGLFPQGKASAKLKVLWEDDFMAVVIKPPGVATHGGTGSADDPGPGGRCSLRQSLPYTLAPSQSTDRPLHRPLHAHRLDKSTGGLVVCAKTRPALTALCNAFEERRVSKRYIALVYGELEGSGAIVEPLDGKTAQTNYRARANPVRSLKTSYITTVDLFPATGRNHQLRRHLVSIGHPILGDKKYTPSDMPLQEGEGMFLWAVGLALDHPITGEKLKFSIPEPDKFKIWREKEHRRWLEHNTTSPPVEDDTKTSAKEGGVNYMPEVEGLDVVDRDGFRYYQYNWSVVGGPPTPLSPKSMPTADEFDKE